MRAEGGSRAHCSLYTYLYLLPTYLGYLRRHHVSWKWNTVGDGKGGRKNGFRRSSLALAVAAEEIHQDNCCGTEVVYWRSLAYGAIVQRCNDERVSCHDLIRRARVTNHNVFTRTIPEQDKSGGIQANKRQISWQMSNIRPLQELGARLFTFCALSTRFLLIA